VDVGGIKCAIRPAPQYLVVFLKFCKYFQKLNSTLKIIRNEVIIFNKLTASKYTIYKYLIDSRDAIKKTHLLTKIDTEK